MRVGRAWADYGWRTPPETANVDIGLSVKGIYFHGRLNDTRGTRRVFVYTPDRTLAAIDLTPTNIEKLNATIAVSDLVNTGVWKDKVAPVIDVEFVKGRDRERSR